MARAGWSVGSVDRTRRIDAPLRTEHGRLSTQDRPGPRFFLKGIAALVALFGVTLLMDTTPELNGLRVIIGVGIAIVLVKMGLRARGIDWPRRR